MRRARYHLRQISTGHCALKRGATTSPLLSAIKADVMGYSLGSSVALQTALGGGQRDAGIDGSLRPANQLAIVPNTSHYTLAVDPMLPEIVERFFGSE